MQAITARGNTVFLTQSAVLPPTVCLNSFSFRNQDWPCDKRWSNHFSQMQHLEESNLMSRHTPVKKHVEMKGWGKQISASPCHPCLKCNTKHFWYVLPSASPYSISSISPSFLRKQNNSDTDGLQVSTLTTKYCFFQRLKMVALALAPHAICQKHSSLPPATISSHSLSWVLF